MKKHLILSLFLVVNLVVYSQQSVVFGTVSDSLQSLMEQANIMVFNQKDSTVSAFGFTDSKGRFAVKVKANSSYFIKCTYLGFETYQKNFVTKSDSIELEIKLKESSISLKGVEIVQEFPVVITGDTITYTTDAFTNGQERKLGDVLNKLPGFDVDKDGNITVQGKDVETVLVDGKKFFDGDTKLAVQNIPADVIDKIDLLTNYNENEQLKGLGTDESMAINIQLKDGKKNIWFGDVEAGIGVESKYLGHANVFRYSPKTNFNFIGDANNISQQAFSMKDYFRFNGGFGGIQNGGSSMQLSADDQGMAMMQNNRSLQSTSSLAAFNINYHPNKKWKFSAFGIANGIKNDIKSVSLRSYLKTNENQIEHNESLIAQELKSVMAKMEAKYTPSSSLQLEYKVFFKASDITDADNRTSNFGGVTNLVNEQNAKNPFSIEQRFNLFKTIGKRNIVGFETNWTYKKQQPYYNLKAGNQPFMNVLPLKQSAEYDLNQKEETITNSFKSELSYYFLLNPRNHIHINAGIRNLHQNYKTGVNQVLDDGNINTLPSTFKNDSKYAFMDTYAGIHFKTKMGKFTFSPGLNVHNYKNKLTQFDKENTRFKTLFLPDFYSRYSIGKTENITFNYGVNAQFTDVQNLSEGGVIRNYTSLFTGNQNLENLWYHNLSLSYMNFSMYHHTNLFFTVNYQKKYDVINESVVYEGINRLSVPTNSFLANDFLMVMGSFEKKYLKWKYRFGADVMYTDYQNTIELIENRNTSFTQTYRFSTETNFTKWPNVEIGMESKWSGYSSSGSRQVFVTNSPYASIEIVFPKGFLWTVDYTFTDYHSTTNSTKSQYDFLNTSLYYRKKGSDWEFKISGHNLLNTQYIRRDSFSDNVISTNQYYVQPRFGLVSVKYDI